ncbi:DUF5615 family PIN-like protein [Dyadobacter sp. CY323]|uniref:DUF5615 family PIN-like protein n=1 Tax=Dyadobacter sp. CY323 TaxID=2907302 RepID=UPI001F2944A1|nr:DUF5615 family PIN-like protein [Dyadobacter sp. CY323]MCE6991655.1 DUF5615 family PIN-like protein [Dyadobacter sp. CY323]
MEFLCDVHISIKLAKFLQGQGHIAIHVNNLPEKWHTSDTEICRFADLRQLILITKDEDFRNTFFLKSTPKKLIRITLGNISNQRLLEIFSKNLSLISDLDKENCFYLELGDMITVYTPNS